MGRDCFELGLDRSESLANVFRPHVLVNTFIGMAVYSFCPEALGDLPHQHRPDPQPHDEDASESIQQVGLAFQLRSVGVDDGNGNDADEAVEGVELRKLELVAVDHDDPEDHLDEHRCLGQRDIPPQAPGPEGLDLVGSK